MKKEQGSALIYVLIISVVLSILGVAILNASLSETKLGINQEKNTKTYYAARAGIDSMVSYLISNPEQLETIINFSQLSKAKGDLGSASDVEFEVEVSGTKDNFVVHAIGKSISNSSIQKDIYASIKAFDFTEYGLFADQIIVFGNNQTISGQVGLNSGEISGGSHVTFDQPLVLGPTAENNLATSGVTIIQAGSTIDFSKLLPKIIAAFPSGTSSYLGSKTINATAGTVQKFIWDGSGTLTINGTGDVHVLLDNHTVDFTLNIGDIVNNSNAHGSNASPKANLTVYTTKTMTFTIPSGNSEFNMNLIAPYASVDISGNGGGTLDYVGTMLVNSYIGGNSNANFSSFKDQGGSLNDVIIERYYYVDQLSDN